MTKFSAFRSPCVWAPASGTEGLQLRPDVPVPVPDNGLPLQLVIMLSNLLQCTEIQCDTAPRVDSPSIRRAVGLRPTALRCNPSLSTRDGGVRWMSQSVPRRLYDFSTRRSRRSKGRAPLGRSAALIQPRLRHGPPAHTCPISRDAVEESCGVTTEIAIHPPATMNRSDWRVAVADVARDGSVPRPRVDRTIVVIDGAGMRFTAVGPQRVSSLRPSPSRLLAKRRRLRARRRARPRFQPMSAWPCARRWPPSRALKRMSRPPIAVIYAGGSRVWVERLAAGPAAGHTLIVERSVAKPRRPCGPGADAARRGADRCVHELYAADALTPQGWRRDVRDRYRSQGHDHRGPGGAKPEGRCTLPVR